MAKELQCSCGSHFTCTWVNCLHGIPTMQSIQSLASPCRQQFNTYWEHGAYGGQYACISSAAAPCCCPECTEAQNRRGKAQATSCFVFPSECDARVHVCVSLQVCNHTCLTCKALSCFFLYDFSLLMQGADPVNC